ncbi:MAG: hypothetical protein KAG61_00410 [Bacteriovoracaceae bacterium]|nr:hypothetical protein [Bacteriovoracaceae bacterium]
MNSKKIVILSRCKSVERKRDNYYYNFPMKGAYCGVMIRSVKVRVDEYKDIIPGKDYILAVNLLEVRDKNILCKLVKYKIIE